MRGESAAVVCVCVCGWGYSRADLVWWGERVRRGAALVLTTVAPIAAQVLMNVVSDEAGKQLLRRGDLDGIGKVCTLDLAVHLLTIAGVYACSCTALTDASLP